MRKNCLTSEQKNKLINLTLLPEILGEDYGCLMGAEDRRKLLDAKKLITQVLESNVTTMTKELIYKLLKEIRGLKFVINSSGEPKKSERIINSFDLETVLEHSLVCCVNCTKNHKNCRLHEAFKRLVVPVADPDQKGCKYRIDKEV